ncbi:MAG: DUF790 family protein [Chloroflexi bacterium]|nr:DUF790 family protein [Chloroflexota bacterium]
MTFPLKDVRYTTRRTGNDDEPLLYPRLLRDRSIVPKIAIAVQYFESMRGHERREFDPEVLVQFFGDHKLARCVVTCLARSYRFRAPKIDEIATQTALRKLQRAGLDSPVALRLSLFDRVNDDGDGFLRGEDRDPAYAEIERVFSLRAGELERLLRLDDEEHAVLVKIGDTPPPEDVVAQYNFGVLAALLRHAEQIDLVLAARAPEQVSAIRRLCAAHGVDVNVGESGAAGNARRVTLHGRQDAMGVWARHGRRVARTAVRILERFRSLAQDGSAKVALRDHRARLRLTSEVLDLLGGPSSASAGWDEISPWHDLLAGAAAGLRAARGAGAAEPGKRRGRAGRTDDAAGGDVRWTIRRFPDPQAWAAGVLVPDLLVEAGARRLLVCAVDSPAHGTRMTSTAKAAAANTPVLFVGEASAVAPLQASGATVCAPLDASSNAASAAVAAAIRGALFGAPAQETACA